MDEAWDQQMIYAAQTGEGASGGQNLEISFTKGQMAMQPQGNIGLHKKMAKLFHQYKKKGDETIFKKYAVRVTSDHSPNDAKISLTVAEKESSVLFSVENSGLQQVYFTLQNFDLVENIFTIRDCDGNLIRTITDHLLLPGDSYEIKINFTSDHPGFYEQILVFKFKRGYDHPEFFEIMRLLEVEFQTAQSEKDSLHGSEVMKRFQTANRRPFTRGENFATPVVHLKQYPMPKNFRENKEIQEILRSNPLNWGNYSRRFHLLLHLEEYNIRKGINQCSLNKVPLTFYEMDKNMLVVKAEHFLNKSLTVLTGCIVEVTPLKQKMDKVFYKGWVDDVDEEQIYLRIYEDLPEDFQNELACSLVFLLHRMPLRMQHRAADLVRKHQLRDLVFPTQHSCLAPPIPKLIRTPALESNPEQRRAVEHILARSAKPAPYLIFGPPGTGKSVTLVEVIKQIVKTQDCNILVCAPSNSVTDHLCKKILEENIVPRHVFRLYSLSYNANKIPESVKEHCSFDGTENYFEIPTKKELMSYKIMVTTLQSAGRLVTAGVPPGYYSYIIVDEAGQAKELECFIPIAGLLKPETGQVVLAGDPKQLGPVIISTIAGRFGLGVSFLTRLMTEVELYRPNKTNGYNNCFVTKLLKNYRSHPAILKIPNELFYNAELQPCGHLEKSLYNDWELLPRKNFPVIFHGVAGMKKHDFPSPSSYNMFEVDILKEYLKSLISFRHKKGLKTIEPKEIGIISPYKKQEQKIKAALRTDKDLVQTDVENILVGTVEMFQGQERDVILVSTVHSTPRLDAAEQNFSLGFVKDEKRFNVAMTRARNLLIVLGDPRALERDPVWKKFIHYCLKERAYRGILISSTDGDAEAPSHAPTPAHSRK